MPATTATLSDQPAADAAQHLAWSISKQATRTPSIDRSASTNSIELDRRRSLADSLDPIHKRAARSRSREPPNYNDTGLSGQLAIHTNVQAGANAGEHLQGPQSARSDSPSSFASSGFLPATADIAPSALSWTGSQSTSVEGGQQRLKRDLWRLPSASIDEENVTGTQAGHWNTFDVRRTHSLVQPSEKINSIDETGALSWLNDTTDAEEQRLAAQVSAHYWNEANTARRSLSTSGMAAGGRDLSRPPVVHRPLSVSTAHLDKSTQHSTFSPASLRSISPDGSSSFHLSTSPRLGLARLPEGEVIDDSRAVARHSGFFSSPTGASQRASRSRSTSSAAALQSDERGSPYTYNALDHLSRSASLWQSGPISSGEAGSSGPRTLSPGHPPGRAFSQHGLASPSFSSSFGGAANFVNVDRGRRADVPDNQSVSLRDNDADVPVGHLSAIGESQSRSGTESRRHSMTAVAPPTGQRRAIGFEVTRPAVVSRNASVGRPGSTISSNQASTTFGLFGAGNSAISDDDLAADFDALRVNLDEVARQQQQQQQQSSQNFHHNGMQRIPSASANIVGTQASSMPSRFAGFGMSPSDNLSFDEWSRSARTTDEPPAAVWGNSLGASLLQGTRRRATDATPPPSYLGGGAHAFGVGQGAFDNSQRVVPPSASNRQRASSAIVGDVTHSRGGSSMEHAHGTNMSFGGAFQPTHHQQQHPNHTSYSQQAHYSKSPAAPSLSEYAIASLVSLGPLAPSGGSGAPEPHNGAGQIGFGGGNNAIASSSLQDLGKGVPLQMLPRDTPLYIVEFKQGRTDLYFRQTQAGIPAHVADDIRKGDLVIVEADRGKDLGTVINDSITVDQVQTFLTHQAELAQMSAHGSANSDAVHPAAIPLSRLTRSINPKRLFAKAGPADTGLLHAKGQDEERALTLCTTKVNQRGLPMTVVAAELQWDRRKLTFYYTATQRVDFRDLVKELFRLYKTRIWMCHLSHPSSSTGAA